MLACSDGAWIICFSVNNRRRQGRIGSVSDSTLPRVSQYFPTVLEVLPLTLTYATVTCHSMVRRRSALRQSSIWVGRILWRQVAPDMGVVARGGVVVGWRSPDYYQIPQADFKPLRRGPSRLKPPALRPQRIPSSPVVSVSHRSVCLLSHISPALSLHSFHRIAAHHGRLHHRTAPLERRPQQRPRGCWQHAPHPPR